MFPTLETQKLILRKIVPEDAKDLFDFLSDVTVNQYTTHNPFENIVQVQRLINGMQQGFDAKQKILLGIAAKGAKKIIGYCGFHAFDEYNLIGDISFCLAKEHWGQGIMTEAIQTMVQFGFEKIELNRIEAKAMFQNTSSFRVLEKAGFQKEGLIRQGLLKNHAFYDLYLYSILKSDYPAQSPLT
jgi:ribosomal-protein-alanine N-acetyltransferase